MFGELLTNALGQMVGELFGETIDQKLDRRALLRGLEAAVSRAETRFAREYRERDAELADVLSTQTRFADLPSVRAALRDLLTRPFHDPASSVTVLRQSFADVLPERIERARVDAAVQTFLGYLGQEVLYIPQLRELYGLAFQKTSADQSRAMADHTARLVQSIQELRDDMRQIAATPAPLALPAAGQASRRALPWHNLPQRGYSQFVGRQAELAKLTELLLPHPRSRHFVVTLDGIGGVGKSALALELAYRYRDEYASQPEPERFDAIVWISAKRTLLTASGIQQRQQTFNTLGDLYREIATVLEQPDILQSDAAQRRALAEHALAAQRTLLIVDNLETVDDEELLSFLRELPDPTKAIVTTRHRIDIAYSIRLSGMPEPDAQALMELEAARKNVELPAAAIGDLYRRTGGIPLAIVWSIGLMSMGHSVESVLRRLGSGQSDIARFCFAESMARIRGRDPERLLFALALFERSVSRAMLGEVAGLGDDVIGRDDGLAELLQLSLIDQKGDRFKLLPLTHSFARDTLAGQPELERELRGRWMTCLTELARPYIGFHWHRRDLDLLRREGKHLVTLAAWAQDLGRLDVLLEIVPALIYYWDLLGSWTPALAISQLGLNHARLVGNLPMIIIIQTYGLVWIQSQQGRHDAAIHAGQETLAIARQLGDPLWVCEVLYRYSAALRRASDLDRAEELCRQAWEESHALADDQRRYMQANINHEFGKVARDRGEWQAALAFFSAARAIFDLEDDNPMFNLERAWGVRSNIAFVKHQLGEYETSAQEYRQCLTFFRDTGGKSHMTTLLVRLAQVEQQLGRYDAALLYAQEALDWSRKLSMAYEQAQVKALLAGLSALDRNEERS